MDNVKDYKVETGKDSNELLDKVIADIRQGWTPIGGVSVATEVDSEGNKFYTYAQALVKHKTKDKKKNK